MKGRGDLGREGASPPPQKPLPLKVEGKTQESYREAKPLLKNPLPLSFLRRGGLRG